MKLIIDFEAITRQYKTKAHNINDIPYCLSLLLLEVKNQNPACFFLDVAHKSTAALFIEIKKLIVQFLKRRTGQTIIKFRDVQFYCFGKALETKILKEIFSAEELNIVDLNYNYKVGLSDLVGAFVPRNSKHLFLEKIINQKIMRHYETKKMQNFERWNLKSSGSKAALLGYFLYLEALGESQNRHYITGLKVKEVHKYLKLYSLQDAMDIKYLFKHKTKIAALSAKVAQIQEKRTEIVKLKKAYEIVLGHVRKLETKVSLVNLLERQIKILEEAYLKQVQAINELLRYTQHRPPT